jgi:hypothetical protein
MKRAILLSILMLLLLPVTTGARTAPSAGPAGQLPQSSGRGLGFDFDIITDLDKFEANVSNPGMPSATVVAVIKNNASIPFTVMSVRLSVTVNLGGTATVVPEVTPFIPYQGQTTAVVTVTLPEDTHASLQATLRIDGVCVQSNQYTDYKQVALTILQWHSLQIQNVSLSSPSPVENEVVQINSRVMNNGNGPTLVMVGAFVDNARLTTKVDGSEVDDNSSVKLDPGKFFFLTATWKASYGRHTFALEAEDIGPPDANLSSAIVSDSKMVSVFVNYNMREWIPYFMLACIIAAAAVAVAFRYRKRLAARYPRFGRAFSIKLPPPGPRTAKFQKTVGAQVKRARMAAARMGQRPVPRYVSQRVRSDIDRIRSRTIPKGPPPDPEQIERMKPPEKRGLR